MNLQEQVIDAAITLFENRSKIESIGLINGKMGLCINLFKLSRIFNHALLNNYAETVLEEVFDKTGQIDKVNFIEGASGIGWGIEFLVQNNFIDFDTNELLLELDTQIIFKRFDKFSIQNILAGAIGVGFYYINRLKNGSTPSNELPMLLMQKGIINFCDSIAVNVELIAKFNSNSGLLSNALMYLEQTAELGIYNYRVKKIFDFFWVKMCDLNTCQNLEQASLICFFMLKVKKSNSFWRSVLNENVEEIIENKMYPQLKGFLLSEDNIEGLFYVYLQYNEIFAIDNFLLSEEHEVIKLHMRKYLSGKLTNDLTDLTSLSILNGFVSFEKIIYAIV